MAVTVQNGYAQAKDQLREALVRSSDFQSLVGAANAAEARDRVLVGETDVPPALPYVCILDDEAAQYEHRRIGVGAFRSYPTLMLQMYGAVPSEAQSSARLSAVAADSDFGALLDILRAVHMTACDDSGTLLLISNITSVMGPQFASRGQQDDQGISFQSWQATITVKLGDE